MNALDRETNGKLQRLESIDARLQHHERTVRFGLMWLSVIGVTTLGLMVYLITRV